ncbi:hypothetical protein HHK36_004320 [Tetracentron sinense]|uniref:Uncharacterized protein n=1 Tax=Tetracentron sinense TaxID=13715 RepID=A0A834ZSQ3_TETSI|nr:hypothetical protein HHK36_004320 [Tetracentron sinense]
MSLTTFQWSDSSYSSYAQYENGGFLGVPMGSSPCDPYYNRPQSLPIGPPLPSLPQDPDLKEVREKEGIPVLEDEIMPELVKEALKEKKNKGGFNSITLASPFAFDDNYGYFRLEMLVFWRRWLEGVAAGTMKMGKANYGDPEKLVDVEHSLTDKSWLHDPFFHNGNKLLKSEGMAENYAIYHIAYTALSLLPGSGQPEFEPLSSASWHP